MNYQALYQNPCYLLPYSLLLRKSTSKVEDVKDQAVEVVGVATGVSEVVCGGAKEEVPSVGLQGHGNVRKQCCVGTSGLEDGQPLRFGTLYSVQTYV